MRKVWPHIGEAEVDGGTVLVTKTKDGGTAFISDDFVVTSNESV